ncbi:MAG: YtrH family sporulation protein [bacterium]
MNKIIPVFFIALGVVLGGAIIGSIGDILRSQPPLKTMINLAEDLKLYAIICAIGGTFNNLRLLEGSVFGGEIIIILQQFCILLSAFIGAQLGYRLITIICGGG